MIHFPDFLRGITARRTRRSKGPSHRVALNQRTWQSGLEALERRDLLTIAVTPTFTVTQDWGSGYQAQLRLDNRDTVSLTPWKLEFDSPATISSIWDAQITSHTGNHYVITGASWNNALPAGGSVQFGFVASPGGTPPAPTGYLINGNTLGSTASRSALSVSDATVLEGQSGTTNAVFTVSLSAAATSPVTVNYLTSNGTALAEDFQATSGSLSFAPGQTAKTITVKVLGDTKVEADEIFYVDLRSPVGAVIARTRGVGTIKNDDTATAPSGDFQFAVTSDWGTGFTAQLTIRNSTATAVSNWQLEFDFPGTITDIWDAKVVSHVGNHYVLANAGYNSVIAAGASLAIGFNGSPGGVTVGPTNYVLRAGTSTGGGTGGGTTGNHAPVANDDNISTLPGQNIVIAVLANDTDADGDALSVTSITAASHGAAVLNANGTVTYTPTSGYTGTDTLTYQIRDAQGATATGKVSITIAVPSAWPAHVFAPYVDMTLYPIYDLVSVARSQGLRYFTLAFIVADPTHTQPAWGGFSEYMLGTAYDTQMKTQIAGLRALGGDVVVSFGGAANSELAEVITDVNALKQAYQSVINAYGLTHIDFDIEGAAVANHASIDRRNQALAALQADAAAAGRPLSISYTLPVLPTGLTADGLYVIQSAARFGVRVEVVNVMTMDYGDSAAPSPAGKMGDYAIAAANSLFTQLKSVYGTGKTDAQLWQMLGITPMIGLNDIVSETFDQQEAREVLAFAQQKGIGRLAFWSLNRDQQSPSGKLNSVDNFSSSLLQSPFEFSQIFKPFTG